MYIITLIILTAAYSNFDDNRIVFQKILLSLLEWLCGCWRNILFPVSVMVVNEVSSIFFLFLFFFHTSAVSKFKTCVSVGGLSYLRGRGRRWLRLPGLAPPWFWEPAVGRRWRGPRRRTERWPGPTYSPGPVAGGEKLLKSPNRERKSTCVWRPAVTVGYWRVCCLQWWCCWLAVAAGSAPVAVSASGPAAPDAAGTVRLWKLRKTRVCYRSGKKKKKNQDSYHHR